MCTLYGECSEGVLHLFFLCSFLGAVRQQVLDWVDRSIPVAAGSSIQFLQFHQVLKGVAGINNTTRKLTCTNGKKPLVKI